MGAFVSKTPVKVTLEGRLDEWIAIVPKLGAGARADLQNKLLLVKMGEDDAQGGNKADIEYQAGLLSQTLLEAGIVGWRLKGAPDCGLDLDEEGYVKFKVECIRSLDLDDELVDKALEELTTRNPLGGKRSSANKRA